MRQAESQLSRGLRICVGEEACRDEMLGVSLADDDLGQVDGVAAAPEGEADAISATLAERATGGRHHMIAAR